MAGAATVIGEKEIEATPAIKEVAKNTFTYANMVTNGRGGIGVPSVEDSAYLAIHARGFIQFGRIINFQKKPPEHGWKFHIAVAHTRDNIDVAWNFIKDILIDYEIVLSKVVKPDIDFNPGELGKQITIYAFMNPEIKASQWVGILEKMELGLRKLVEENRLAEGKFCKSDRVVPNSRFISYRSDAPISGSDKPITEQQAIHIAHSRATEPYNPYSKADPYREIRMPVAEPVRIAMAGPA